MKNNRATMLIGGALILLGALLLLENLNLIHVIGRMVWSVGLIAVGLPFLLVFLSNREQWWALIPGSIMMGIGLGVLFRGEMAAIVINASISLPFWLIYLNDREQWWALIPGWVMACVTAIIVLAWIGMDWFVAPFVMFAIAIPFLLVYVLHRDQWWALIPGGIMAGIGGLILLGETLSSSFFWAAALILLGVWFIVRALRSPGQPDAGAVTPPPAADATRFEVEDLPDPAAEPDQPR